MQIAHDAGLDDDFLEAWPSRIGTDAPQRLGATFPFCLRLLRAQEFDQLRDSGGADAFQRTADILNIELKSLVAAGCDLIQIDEPVWVGYPEDMPWLVESFNRLVNGVKATIALHTCYGNYQLKRLYTGQYEELFPAILDTDSHQISLEFAVSDGEGLDLFKKYKTDKEIVVGVIDVKSEEIETPEEVAARIRKALEFIPANKMWISPDCGMKFMPRDRAFGKLKAMVEGTRLVRAEL
jgi:5-methyltetrahydropteroyltriglutamate--homocysteine methyltransferase